MDSICEREGQHRYHVADVALVPAEGKVVVIALCISCGNVLSKDVKVTTPHSHIDLLSNDKKEKK
jgi:hypothetical protein